MNQWFALQTLTLALWIIGIAGTHAAYYPEFWGRWTFASACLIPPTFFGFTCVFPDDSGPKAARGLQIVVVVGLILAALSAFTPLIAHTFVITPTGLRRRPGPLFPFFGLYLLTGSALVIGLLTVKWRRATGQAKAQLRFYNVGLITLCVGGIGTNLVLPALTGHSEYSTVGPFFVVPLVGLIGHAIIRHRLFDLRLMIHRGAAFVIMIGSLSAITILALKPTGIDEPFDSIAVPFDGLVVILVAAILLSQPVAPRLARLLDSYLLRSRPDPGGALQEAARRLSHALTVADITREIEGTLRTTLAVETVIVLTDRLHRGDLPQIANDAAWGITIPAPALLVLARESESPEASIQAGTLRQCGFEVWVGLGRGAQTGIVLLGPRNGGEAYLAGSLQFIEDIAELGSMALEVAFLHRRQIELERERHRLEHLARMGRAYAGLGHEIRTPLTTISNLVSLIPDRLDDPEFRDILTRLIPGEVSRIVRLTEKLRLLAPGESGQLGPVSLRKLLTDLVAIFGASADHIAVQLNAQEQLPLVQGDEAQLIQLFTNLINNAIEAMPEGGTVNLRLQTMRTSSGSSVTVEVIDEGPGIPREIAERIFEPFFTTKQSGTGLGLSICREIADFHGATLEVCSGPRGCIATVEFPLTAEPARQPGVNVVDNDARGSRLNEKAPLS
jgi:signal transduction histidine kinase